MQHEKAKRERENNWDMTEKEIFRQLLDHQKEIIENKSNDVKMIAKKKAAWEAIRIHMLAAGYTRSVDKLKQQWTRFKVAAKRSHTESKKAVKATGNVVPLPVVDPFYSLVQGMISDQLEEDTIHIDSNTDILPVPTAIKESDGRASTSAGFVNPSDLKNSDSDEAIPPLIQQAPPISVDLLSNLRQLPRKTKTKTDVMTSRANQIDEGTSNAADLHLLHMEHAKKVLILDDQLLANAKEESAHAREKHLLEIEQMKELHNKRMAEF